ncbi:MAG: 16S rRNA (guanine(966)-N(2))-methyltransferase RsmD [Syntrophales bacterium]|nr:16S rRNA (guanine(966)-N(2))-methyltransferase RsmD [Syntrophales bacterium]
MRIIAGEARGRRIPSPRGRGVRPTPQKVKEALFAILPDMAGKAFLDLYAGTGAVGFEALSRGAARVVFVEKSRRLVEHLRSLIDDLGFAPRGRVVQGDVKQAVNAITALEGPFDIIFADPPYDQGCVDATCRVCIQSGLLDKGGMLVIQHSAHEGIEPSAIPNLPMEKWERRYGQTVLSFLKYKPEENVP